MEAVGDDGGRISGIGEISRPSKKKFSFFFFAFFPDLSSFVIKSGLHKMGIISYRKLNLRCKDTSMVLGMQKL